MIRERCVIGAGEIAASAESAGVQSAALIRSLMLQHLSPLNKLAERIYTQWIRGLPR